MRSVRSGGIRTEVEIRTMNRDLIASLFRSFESIAHREGDLEYWLGRELQGLLGYTQWRNFEPVLDRARAACGAAGQGVEDHFADVRKMVELGSGGPAGSHGRSADSLCRVP